MTELSAVWVYGMGNVAYCLDVRTGRPIRRVQIPPGFHEPLAGVGSRAGREMLAAYRNSESCEVVVQFGATRQTLRPGIQAEYRQTWRGFRSSLSIRQPGCPTIRVTAYPVRGAINQRLARQPRDYDIASHDMLARIARIVTGGPERWAEFIARSDPSGSP